MKQRGVTLIDLMVSLAILGTTMAVIFPATYQTVRGTGRLNENAVAVSDIELVSHWVTRDLVQGEATDLVDTAAPVPQVTVTWQDLTNWAVTEGTESHTLIYCYNATSTTPPCDAAVTKELRRDYDGQVTNIGRYLTDVGFSRSGRVVTMTVTSSPGVFSPRATMTRSYSIALRPKE